MNPTITVANLRPVTYMARYVHELDRVVPNGFVLDGGDDTWAWRALTVVIIAPVVPTAKNTVIPIFHYAAWNGEEIDFPGMPMAWYPPPFPEQAPYANYAGYVHIVEPQGIERQELRVTYHEMWQPFQKPKS